MFTNFVSSMEDLNSVLEEYVESEISCTKRRKIYNALEKILIQKEYLQNLDTDPRFSEIKINDTSNLTNHLNKNKPLTKISSVAKVSKSKTAAGSDIKHFILVQKQIQQFESYKNCVNHISNKYPTEFLNLLKAQVFFFYILH